jgi:hypothetical protein
MEKRTHPLLLRDVYQQVENKMAKQLYTISARELVDRRIIRNDQPEEWMNKMTDEELKQWNEEAYAACREDGTPEKFPDLNAAHLAKSIDRTIMYEFFKRGDL